MATPPNIPLPPKTRAVLEHLDVNVQAAVNALNAAMSAVRATLDVPDDWVLLSPDKGFGPKEGGGREVDASSNGVPPAEVVEVVE